MFKVALVHPNSKSPERKSSYAAGLDLYSCETATIPARSRKLVSTGIKVQIPNDCYARVAPRSGLSVIGIDVGAGVVDADYKGIVKVLMINNKDESYNVDIGDRIAQLVFERIYNDAFVVVEESELDSSERGEGGFGSTGK
jgi:dUTP pyrophosphatase